MMKRSHLPKVLFSTILFMASVSWTIAQEVKWAPIDDLAQNYVKKGKNQGLVIGIILSNSAQSVDELAWAILELLHRT